MTPFRRGKRRMAAAAPSCPAPKLRSSAHFHSSAAGCMRPYGVGNHRDRLNRGMEIKSALRHRVRARILNTIHSDIFDAEVFKLRDPLDRVPRLLRLANHTKGVQKIVGAVGGSHRKSVSQ
jgi:hypothetical protein